MVSSSKILTVSYGTFSCTLEGFDESFDTMKAIAEYFRDLAQDDRYFGAEPPTPDAEMLARIAEREIARRVEARMENGSYVLRPSLSGPVADPAASPSEEPKTQPEPQAAASAKEQAATAPAHGNTMAEALAAQQAMATEAAAEAEAEAEAQAKSEAEVEAQDTMPEVPVETPPQAEAKGDEAAAYDADDDDDENTSSVSAAPADQVATPPVATDDNSVAAKLQRIRAVVSASGAPRETYSGPAYSEDEHADAFLTDTARGDAFDSDALDATFADAAPVGDPTPDIEAAEFEAEAEDDADTLGENLFTDTIAGFVADQEDYDDEADAQVEAEVQEPASESAIAASEDVTTEIADDSPDSDEDADAEARDADQSAQTAVRPRARLLRVKRADFEAAVAAGKLEESTDAGDSESSLSPEEEADLARELAEVEAELDRAWDDAEDAAPGEATTKEARPGLDDLATLDDEADDDTDDDAEDDQPKPRRDTGLRLRKDAPVTQSGDIEAEDENEAILAAVSRASQDRSEEAPDYQASADQPADSADRHDEADDAVEATARRAIEGARKTLRLSSPAHAMLTQNKIEEDDTSVSRILDETNTQLEEPEGNRRRSAIAHLRAAVAATRADRILGRKKDPEKETEPYRADLASAVRPRRPMPSSETRSERPAMPRPAPLKLVAEQRIDAPEAVAPQASAPIRPRRVTRGLEVDTGHAEVEDDNGFVAFAEDMGATGLPDLLEAAAAYMSFVEGRDQFSRPQLMTKVRLAESGESSREDRLRSFGQLLRDGKIEKTHGGRFTASERISFKPGARAAG